MSLLGQGITFDGDDHKVTDLIEASKGLPVMELKLADIFTDYPSPCEDTMESFMGHVERVNNADLSYPIILSPGNSVLDGKHRLIKALIEKRETIKAVRLGRMPQVRQRSHTRMV